MKRKIVITVLFLFVVPAILFATNKQLFEPTTIEDSVDIGASPVRILEFFCNLEGNDQAWQPTVYVVFKWIEGKPVEVGTTFYAEENALGEVKKNEETVIKAVPNCKIVFSLSFPISVISPKFEWLIEAEGSTSVFMAVTYASGA